MELYSGQQKLRLSGSKRQTVLSALLLADGLPVSLSRLVDTVWGQGAPPTAAKQIRNATSDIRRIHPGIGAALTLVGDGYQLKIAEDQVDARVFLRRAARGREFLEEGRPTEALEEFRTALSLWRGPALDGLEKPALQAQTTRLNEARLAVLEECMELELSQGQHSSVIDELSVWVAEQPLRERLVSQLMRALYRSGAQARALNVYEHTRQILKNELGISPGPELQELHQHILVNDLPSSSHPVAGIRRNTLPANTIHFTGRVTEQQVLIDSVRNHATANRPRADVPAVLAIDGMPGVGKTALALQIAHKLTPHYPDAQVFLDMCPSAGGDAPLDAHTALGALLSGLGVPPSGIPADLEARSAAWRRLLADRRLLIVLDNVLDTNQILAQLPSSPGSLVLVTSRSRLTNLMPTGQLTLQELPVSDGRELFSRIVGDRRLLLEQAAVDSVLEMCGRLPLAIRLAATKLRHRPSWSVSYLASRLAISSERLVRLTAEDDGLTEAFRQSYVRLSHDQQRVFRILAHIPGDAVDTRTVAALARIPLAESDRLLESLVDAHLLDSNAPGRYRMHPLLHAYAGLLAGGVERSRLVPSSSLRSSTALAGRFPQGNAPESAGPRPTTALSTP
ncbi:BTAD domain-containing putative transcriptional regulator [Streptomyces sp. NPDC016469]|uniref:AfsR/SARP family transcriptional regulator n=1 Tax=Streptomyces sp. NPDC016469 TaxID=3157191 RepID=UPI0033E67B73